MAGLRIRWRRETPGLAPTQAVNAPAERALARFVWPAIALIVLLASLARLYNVNWDQNTHLHPDERGLTIVANDIHLPSGPSEYFDTAHSRLNPYNRGSSSYVYGTAPLFLTKVTGVLLDKDNYEELVLIGRWWSALFSAATVLGVFFIGRRLFGPAAALLGASLIAMAPLAIQHSHFFVVDSFLAFFTTAFLFFCLRVQREGRPRDFALAGLMLGLGLACKLTALVVTPVLLAAALAYAWPGLKAVVATSALGASPRRLLPIREPALGLLLGLFMVFLAFRVAQPYAFKSPSALNPVSWTRIDQKWLDDQRNQSKLLSGDAAFPPSVQWIDRTKYVFPLTEMLQWGMGPGFGLAGWGALLFAAYRLLRHRESRLLLPVVFVAVYFGFMGRQFTLYLRYFLPLYPILAVLAGYALMELVRAGPVWARRWRVPELAHLGYGVAGLTLVLSLLAAIAYLQVYRAPVTRIEASRWLERNLNPGTQIAVEHWDEALPIILPGEPNKQLQLAELPLYDADSPQKMATMISVLDRVNYIVISSNRLPNSIPRNVVSYPVTSHWYEMLDDGSLGFQKLREFTSYPRLGPLEFSDHGGEESWSSYDHPRVLIYQKKPDYTHAKVEALLNRGPAGTPVTPLKAQHHGLLLSARDLATQRENGSWTSVFSDSGIAHSYPTLVWLLLLEAAALAVTPIVMSVFRRLPDRGYLLAKPLGVLALAYPVWMAASLKLVHFDRTAILVTLMLLIVAGYYVSMRQKEELWGFVRTHWRLILVCEAIFLLAFFFFRELRLINPDLWHPSRGGEKPMDLAYLTAVARSTTLPPYDPWFAGGYINYYYLGQFLTATLVKATTIPPEVAFNLAVPTFFALTVAGAYSVSYNLAASARAFLRRGADHRRLPSWSPYAAGVLGVFMVAIFGNLDGVAQMTDRLGELSTWHVHSFIPGVETLTDSISGLYQVIFNGAHMRDFDYWRSSRMLPPTISITEFPYFSFLFADLHAHMMSFAFDIATIAACLALALGRRGERASWQEWALVALLGWLTGGLRVLNSWDYPPFLLLALTAVAISERRLEGGLADTGKRFVAKGVALGGLSVLLWYPFLSHYLTPVSGLHATPETTPLRQYLAHFGALAAPVVGWLAFMLLRSLRASPLGHGRRIRRVPSAENWLAGAILVAGGVGIAAIILVAIDHAFIAALLPFFAVVVYLWVREMRLRRPDGGLRLLLLSMLGLALGLSMGVDLVTLNGDIQRMNTVFKFYLHVWILLALAGSFATWWLAFVVWHGARRPITRVLAVGGGAFVAALLLGALIYPAAATPVREDDRFVDLPNTLDGEAFLHKVTYQDEKGPINFEADYQGFEWLHKNVSGTPAIVEGRTPLYRWGGRFSIYTGLPSVLGWDYHQTQQRGDGAVQTRGREVDTFYASPDVVAAQRFLRAYDVRYVILGQVERLYYPPDGLQKFANGLNGALEVAYQNPQLTIYRVIPGGPAARTALAKTP